MGGIPVNGEVLKALREANGYQQGEFAELIGIDRSSLANIERGHRNASPKVLQQMADVLKVKRTVIRMAPASDE